VTTATTPAAQIRQIRRLVPTVCARIEASQQVRRALPGRGRIHIDRQLPFLVVYRTTPGRPDRGTRELVLGEASYLVAPGDRHLRDAVDELVVGVTRTLTAVFGRFLILEVWAGPPPEAPDGLPEDLPPPPAFRIVLPRALVATPSATRLERSLGAVRLGGSRAEVTIAPGARLAPPRQRSLLTPVLRQLGTRVIGIEVRPMYRSPEGDVYPALHRTLHRQLSRALQETSFEFARQETTHRPRHYQALGRRAVVKAVWQVDRELTEVSRAFDLLLLVTPVNAESAWRAFSRARYQRTPAFVYRPLRMDPGLLQRRLFAIPIERIEDPTLALMFAEKQQELSRQLTLLGDRDTPRFLFDSLALYGQPEGWLVELAADLLRGLAPGDGERRGRMLDSTAFIAAVDDEIAWYRAADPSFATAVELRDDVASVMVSRGNLLLAQRMRFPRRRVRAIIQHEIGVHAVTYHNGQAQPFRLLAAGLAGYEELQEGLGVFAEHLVGGLSRSRLRLIAARVRAAWAVLGGAEFVDTFRLLTEDLGFTGRTAFIIAMRIHRGGGFIKDTIYLRGLAQVLDYLRERGRFETLMVGKIAPGHAPVIEELQRRGILTPPAVQPRYLVDPTAQSRLERARQGLDVRDLAERQDA
jgi:uncharacterized protein (TIGR02421 family)